MSAFATTDRVFFTGTGLDRNDALAIVRDALTGADDGELFLEYKQSESIMLDDGRIRRASNDTTQGFGLRAIAEEATGYAHGNVIDAESLKAAAETVRTVTRGHTGTLAVAPRATNQRLYIDDNPIAGMPFAEKIALLSQIDTYARAKDPRVRQVSAALSGSWQAVRILRADGDTADVRPLVRMNVSIVVAEGDRMESGSYGCGGRFLFDSIVTEESWRHAVDEALRRALVNLEAVNAPAGEMPVVLGAGWPGILLHEAIGHGLEGDFNRKQTSAFSGRIGQRIAAPGVTVIDDGTIADRRGSLTVDDEGTPSARTVLIEDGILKGYMQDRMNARLMGQEPTGNGRRESHASQPMPRMTNTYMLNGEKEPGELIAAVDKGIYAVNFGGGQVDITSGKFVFSASEAYLIENGKLGPAVKGATIIGNGPDALTKVSMIGNDMTLDDGIGTCGKDGQSVPVGVGQPSLLIDELTVGGTAV